MLSKYQLKLFKTSLKTPKINSENSLFESISYLSHFIRIEQLESEIIPYAKKASNNNSIGEWGTPIESFLRIHKDKVQFGQYVDDNLARLNQFKDYLDEGEKIFGEIPVIDFINIAEEWLKFLKANNDN